MQYKNVTDCIFFFYESYLDFLVYWVYSLSFQWNYGSGVIDQVWRISEVPNDPTTDNLYSYSVTGDRSMYQL